MLDLQFKSSNDVINKCLEHIIQYAESDLVFKEKLKTNSQTNADLEWYIMDEARSYLGASNGGISKETVFGWAIHFVDENITKPAFQKKEKEETVADDETDVGDGEERVIREKPQVQPKPQLQPKTKKGKSNPYEGISLFDFQ